MITALSKYTEYIVATYFLVSPLTEESQVDPVAELSKILTIILPEYLYILLQ